ncbi:MAG: hypothetical protein FWE21_02735 [Defluviitaleaceae bacterium]|nr:hypothetical protein [Defluviitaleaceae bacterium]
MKTILLTFALFFSMAGIAPVSVETLDGQARRQAVMEANLEEWTILFLSWEVFDEENFQAPPRLMVEFLAESFTDMYADDFGFNLPALIQEAGYPAELFVDYMLEIMTHPEYARIYIQAFGIAWVERAIAMMLDDLMEIYQIGGPEYLVPFFSYMQVFYVGTEMQAPPRPVWHFTPPTREEVEDALNTALARHGVDLAGYLYTTRGHSLEYFMDYFMDYLMWLIDYDGQLFAMAYGHNWLAQLMDEIVGEIVEFQDMWVVSIVSSAVKVLGVEDAIYFVLQLFDLVWSDEHFDAIYTNPYLEEILADFTVMDEAFLSRLLNMPLQERPSNAVLSTITQDDLEVRHSFSPISVPMFLFEGHVYGAAMNVFFRNESESAAHINLLIMDEAGNSQGIEEVVDAGSDFVLQLPVGWHLVAAIIIPTQGDFDGKIAGEFAFRFTHGSINQ